MSQCDPDILCKLGLYTKADVKKWVIENHPDRHGGIEPEFYKDVIFCFTQKQVCDPKADKSFKSKNVDPFYKFRSSRRARIYNCMRQTENWSKISPNHKLDNN